jgi:hypothetical protein
LTEDDHQSFQIVNRSKPRRSLEEGHRSAAPEPTREAGHVIVLMVMIWWGYQLMAVLVDFGQRLADQATGALFYALNLREAITPDQLAVPRPEEISKAVILTEQAEAKITWSCWHRPAPPCVGGRRRPAGAG